MISLLDSSIEKIIDPTRNNIGVRILGIGILEDEVKELIRSIPVRDGLVDPTPAIVKN